jgi:hypothetical protein
VGWQFAFVMAGLVPAIHVFFKLQKNVDARAPPEERFLSNKESAFGRGREMTIEQVRDSLLYSSRTFFLKS